MLHCDLFFLKLKLFLHLFLYTGVRLYLVQRLVLSLLEKIETIASKIYHASSVSTSPQVKTQLADWEKMGLGHLPICIAKTQYSFSTDPNAKGAPSGHELPIREVRLSNGAEFVIAIAGEIMTMPGLPRVPAATKITLNADGEIEGLF